MPKAHRPARPNWIREPLLHFFLLGALIFAVDYALVGRADDPRTIYVDAKVDGEARKVFKDARGREPNEDELYALRRIWLDNEVLYREGLALGVDKGDKAIRERVIFKMLSVIEAGLKRPPYDERVLQDWFEKNRSRYDEPARYDFQEAVLIDDRSESAMRAFAAALNSGAPSATKADLRIFKGRPHANLVQSYGEAFSKALEASPPGDWRVLATRDGPRLVRLEAITQPKPAAFASLGSIVLQDWIDATMAEQRTAAVRALAKKYKVKADEATQ
jgi:hypothetical protein